MKNFMKKQKILTEILVHFISMLLNQVEPETLTISTPLAWGENHSPGEKCLGKCNHLKKNFGGKPPNPHSLTL